MTDSTNPRIMADNIKELSASSESQAADISALQGDIGTLQTIVGKLQTIDDVEFDTGKRYDGEIIYGHYYIGTMPEITSESTYTTSIINLSDVNRIFTLLGVGEFGTYIGQMPYTNDTGKQFKVYYNTAYSRIMVAANGILYSEANYSVYVEYTKAATPTPDVTPSPDPDTRSLEELETKPEVEPIEEKK